MNTHKTGCFWILALSMTFSVVRAQSPQTLIQEVVDAERTANDSDHSNWMYLEDLRKPKEHVLQWVSTTQYGDMRRVLRRDERTVDLLQQRERVTALLNDKKAQEKQIAEKAHDDRQIDDFLKLLPTAFHWTETVSNPTSTTLRFEPNPDFRPPTREARVFAGMSGNLVVDNQQHRIRSLTGRLIHDVTFGGGLLGRLRVGSSFSLEQERVGESLWQLTAIHVQLQGNALLFKSVSLEQDEERSRFELQTPTLTREEAARLVMEKPE